MAHSSPRLPTASVRIRRRAHVGTHPGHDPCVRTVMGPGHGDAGRRRSGARADHLLRSVIIGGHARRHRYAWPINVCRWELVLLIATSWRSAALCVLCRLTIDPQLPGASIFGDEQTFRLLELPVCCRAVLTGGSGNVAGRVLHRCHRSCMLGFSRRLGRCRRR